MGQFGRDCSGEDHGVGLTYADHAEEQGPAAPRAAALREVRQHAHRYRGAHRAAEVTHVDAEASLVGGRVRRTPTDDALDVVAGYVAANDVSARNLQFSDGQWLRGK